jgi:hypothetical protein
MWKPIAPLENGECRRMKFVTPEAALILFRLRSISTFGSLLNDRFRQYPTIDLLLPRNLGRREIPFQGGLVKEAVFLFPEQIPHTIGVFDQVVVGVRRVIICDALQPVEKAAGIDLDKSVDTNIADIGRVSIEPITDIAMFFNVLSARAMVPFLADFDSFKLPLLPRLLKIPRYG